MIEAANYYQGFNWSTPWFLSVKEYGDAYSNSVPTGGGSLDDLNAVKLYIGLYNNANAIETDKSNYKNAIGRAQTGLETHNTKYAIKSGTLAGENVVGGWFHKEAYNNQMWLDGAYMGSALLAQIVNFNGTGSNVFGSTTADWDMVTKQLNIVWNMCWNPTDKLMYHAFEANAGTGTGTNESKSHAETWAGLNGKTETYTFHSAAYWGRANAWYLMALVDVLEAMKNAGQESTENYKTLKQHLADLAAGIAARQDSNTGGWYQVMDKDASFTASSYNSNWTGKPANVTNYIETSATAIFAAAYFKAVRLGLLSTSPYDYKTIAKNAFEGLVNNYTYLDANGDMQIWGSCRSAGLGGGTGDDYVAGGKKYRNGSNEYYLLGYDVPMVKQSDKITEGKVLGGFIMAATEYERAYQNQDSKQILFAKDLAPSYDFTTTTERELDATAYGDDNVTVSYQWYKDNAKIADATSATYTPTESGNYYCIATANDKTITTSTTTVKAKNNSNTGNGSTDNNGGSENGTTTGNIFSYTIKASEATANTPYTAEGGTVTLGAANNVYAENGYKLDSDFNKSGYIKITLSGTKLQEGDAIKISAYSSTKGKGGLVAYTGTTTGSSSVSLGNMTQKSEDISYTVKASDILNGLSTFYIYRKTNESTYVKSISITRANTQVALTASFSPATMSATEGDVAKELPTLTVKAGETTLTATDYNVTYASDNDAVAKVENGKVSFVGEGETNIVATIKPTDTNKYQETSATFAVKVEKKQTPVTPTEDVIYNWNTIGSQKENIAVTEGTKNINGTSVPCINFGSNYNASRYTYMSIKDKDNGGFKAGDIITITGLYTGNKTTGIGMEIHTTRDGKAVFSTPYYNKELQTYTYTLTEDCDSLFFGRYGGATPNVTELKVVRPVASAKQQLSANFDTNNIKVVTGTTSITLPNLTVKAGSTELAASDYSVSYESDANEIATVNGTQVNFNAGKTGLVTITAKVTPNDAAQYEGTEAYYQILIQDPTPLNISVTDIDMNATDAEIKEPVVKVYGENDQLLKLGTDYILSYKSNGDPVSFPDGKLTVAGSSYNWTEGTSTITVTATPTANMGNAYKAGSVDFVYAVRKGLITPKFLDTFNNIIVKLATKTGSKDNTNTFTVPLIFNGEDVSSYFDYTYDITSTSPENQQNVNGNVLTYYPKNAGTYTVKVSATVKKNEKDPTLDYSDVYSNPTSITFTLDVNATYIRPVVKLNPVSVNMYTGTREDAPDVTITNYKDNSVIDESNYEVSWTTFTPGICKVDANGNIETVSEGDGKIRVVVRGDKMESTTAFLKVLVDDPAMYRVKGTGIKYGNHTTMWNQDKTMSVVLGGWLFSDDVEK